MPTILERLERLDSDRDPEEPGALTLLCEHQDLDYGTVAKIIYRWKNPTCSDGALRSLDFDTADKLLCGLNLMDLWRGELADYYYSVDLTWKRCECPGCEVMFQATRDKAGRLKQGKYCSEACRSAAYRLRAGKTERRVKKAGKKGYCWRGHRLTPENTVNGSNGHKQCRQCNNMRARERRALKGKCRNGHDRTPENTKFRPDGRIVCKDCRREARREVRQRNRQAVAA